MVGPGQCPVRRLLQPRDTRPVHPGLLLLGLLDLWAHSVGRRLHSVPSHWGRLGPALRHLPVLHHGGCGECRSTEPQPDREPWESSVGSGVQGRGAGPGGEELRPQPWRCLLLASRLPPAGLAFICGPSKLYRGRSDKTLKSRQRSTVSLPSPGSGRPRFPSRHSFDVHHGDFRTVNSYFVEVSGWEAPQRVAELCDHDHHQVPGCSRYPRRTAVHARQSRLCPRPGSHGQLSASVDVPLLAIAAARLCRQAA